MARKQNWLGTSERKGLLYKRLRKFIEMVPKIAALKEERIRGYLLRSRLIESYLSSASVAKLQLGAAANVMEGWLNTSIRNRSREVVYLDVTQPFPFGPDAFDYILSEHLIEHLSYNDGKFMLAECLRILKPGGRIRISTPDLGRLAGLVSEETGNGRRYIEWLASTFPRDVPLPGAAVVVNNLFYNWGHRFLYDFPTLKTALEEAGFVGVMRYEMGESDDATLRGVELHVGRSDVDREMSRFEALVVEAVHP